MKPRISNLKRGFTLIEMLISMGVMLTLAALAIPVASTAVSSSNRMATLNNMRQLGMMMTTYMGQNNGALPKDKGDSNDSWANSSNGQNDGVWYNALPQAVGIKSVKDYASASSGKQNFYSTKSAFFLPTATYPSDRLTASSPYFAVAMNSKLIQSDVATCLSMVTQPVKTVAFLETGLPTEIKYRSKQTYGGQPYAFASRFVARYDKNTQGVLVFLDGHASLMNGNEVVTTDNKGKAYYPQLSNGGSVLWTTDPDADANL